jgi:hypothetical protein
MKKRDKVLMELMEIIKSSLSIFSIVSFVFIITSYTIFKIKDRTRIKPYLRVNMQSPYNDIILEEVVHEDKISPVETIVVKQPIVNSVPTPLDGDARKIQIHERFKIVNQIPAVPNNIPDPEPEQEQEIKPEIEKPVKKIRLKNENLYIYEFYSDTNEKMHKLKLAVM